MDDGSDQLRCLPPLLAPNNPNRNFLRIRIIVVRPLSTMLPSFPSVSSGLLLAAGSALFNGSFATLAKLKSLHVAGVSPVLFNYWMAEGAALAGFLALAAEPRVFTAWGILSGALFVAATLHSFLAIHYLGLSVASGIWCGVAVLASFCWGVGVEGDRLSNPSQGGVALLMLMAGVAGIAVAGQFSQPREAAPADEEAAGIQAAAYEQPPASPDQVAASGPPTDGLSPTQALRQRLLARETNAPPEAFSKYPLGVAAAIVAGACGGLILAPMLAAPPEYRGIPFIPSMSAAIFVCSPLTTFAAAALGGIGDPLQALGPACVPGLLAGAIWQAGNFCSILAVQDPRVGLAVAYPIMQCGLFVAGAWGILLFKEIPGRWQLLYWASGAVLLEGAALLSAAK